MVRRGVAGVAVVGVLAGLTGCGDTDSADQDDDTVPTTPRTLAALATEVLEEDPGLLVLRHFDDGVLEEVFYAGQPITGDPREQADLEVPVSRFEDLLADDRLGLVAPAELADAPLPGWSDDTP